MYYSWNKKFSRYKDLENKTELEVVNDKLKKLREEFGSDFTKPRLEHFGLDDSSVQFIIKKNRIANIIKKTITYTLIILIYLFALFISAISDDTIEDLVGYIPLGIFLFFFIRPMCSDFAEKIFNFKKDEIFELNRRYTSYLEKENSYPGKEKINFLLSRAHILKEQKKKKEYWFSLSGHDFEKEMAGLFRKYNYKSVLKTRGSGDGGVDLIITKHDEGKIFVQCKAHKKPAGPHVVRDLFGAMKSEGVDHGILISLSGVSKGVMSFIKDKNIDILDIDGIIKMNTEQGFEIFNNGVLENNKNIF